MKKQGYTLIEMVIVLCIIVMIITIPFISYSFFKKVQIENNIKCSIQGVDDMINYSRLYCRRAKKKGTVSVDFSTGQYQFNFENKAVRKEKLEDEIKFESITTKDAATGNKIEISNKGEPEAGSINLIDINGKRYSIKIQVGNHNEEIY